jgi:hypothetical protein
MQSNTEIEDWVGDGLSDQGSQSSEQAGKRKRSKYMLSGDGTGGMLIILHTEENVHLLLFRISLSH